MTNGLPPLLARLVPRSNRSCNTSIRSGAQRSWKADRPFVKRSLAMRCTRAGRLQSDICRRRVLIMGDSGYEDNMRNHLFSPDRWPHRSACHKQPMLELRVRTRRAVDSSLPDIHVPIYQTPKTRPPCRFSSGFLLTVAHNVK